MKQQKQVYWKKPFAPSKWLWLEAKWILKEWVQEIVDIKGLKVQYCNLKECEEHHLNATKNPHGVLGVEMGWPHDMLTHSSFVHK